jgi:hypothetical protein
MKSSKKPTQDEVAQTLYDIATTRMAINPNTKKYVYDTGQKGTVFFANQLNTNLKLRGDKSNNTAPPTTLGDNIDSETAKSFLSAATKAIEEGDKKTQDKTKNIVLKQNILDITHSALKDPQQGPEIVAKYAENTPEFADEFVKKALESKDPKDKETLKFLVNYKGKSSIYMETSKFEKSLNKLMRTSLTETQLIGIFNADLGDKINKKVIIKTLAKKAQNKFKEMLQDEKSGLFEAIKTNKLQGLTVGGKSLLKASITQPKLAAKMMGAGFTFSKEEIEQKGYKPPNGKEFTANDHIRMAIGEMSGKKIDLTKKKSPLALARETGQTELANALKEQGYGLKKTELMMRVMKKTYQKMPSFSIPNFSMPNIMGKNKGAKGRGK